MFFINILGTFLLWFVNVLTSALKRRWFGDDVVFSVDGIVDMLNAVDNVYNVFSWVNYFVPVDFLLLLVLMITIFYSYKFLVSIVRYIISFFK